MRFQLAFVLTVAASLAVGALSPAAQADGSAVALLAKHAAFAGWRAGDPSMLTLRLKGASSGGMTDGFTEVRRGLLFRDTVTTPQGVREDSGFTGRVVWRSDANGFPRTLLGVVAQTIFDFDIVRAEAVAQFGGAIVAGTANVRGTPCTDLRIVPKGALPMDVCENPSTGAFLRVVVAPGTPHETTFDILRYAGAGGGKKVVGAWSVGNVRYSVDSVEANAAISNAQLEGPVPSATWAFGSQSVPVMFDVVTDNLRHVIVNASVNGHSGLFLLNTDAPSIILYGPFAAQLGLTYLGTSDFSPYVGNPQFKGYARTQSLQVGDSTLHNAVVQIFGSPNAKLAGVLGYDFFARALVNVDLAGKSLTVLDPVAYQPKAVAGSYAFPVDLTQRVPNIDLRLPSGASAYPMLDTGLAGFMILAQALHDSNAVGGLPITSYAPVLFGAFGATGDPVASQGMSVSYVSWNDASTSGTCVTLPKISVGPYEYTNPPICFGGANVFGQDRGAIGLDFLRHFNWTIDYPDAKFMLTPNEQ